MDGKLQLSAIGAVKDFTDDCNIENLEVIMNVTVEIDGELLENPKLKKTTVQFSRQFDKSLVYIFWEEILGENYKDKYPLFGTYNTDFNKMEYSYKNLTIYSVVDGESVIINIYG